MVPANMPADTGAPKPALAPATGNSLALTPLGLGELRSTREKLGRHLSQDTKEKIWSGAYVNVFSLLVDEAEREEAKKNK